MKHVWYICPLAKQLGKSKIHRAFAVSATFQRSQHGSAQASEKGEITTPGRLDLQSPSVTKWKRPPFVKDLFLGKFDTHVLAFPEVLNKDQVEELEHCVKNISDIFKEKVNSMQIEKDKKIPEDFIQTLKDLGFFGRMLPKEYGGLGLTRTEYLRLNEVVSLDSSIGASLCAHEFMGAQAILLFGNEEQKKKYLPDLASGKKIAAVAYYETPSGSDPLQHNTCASFMAENQCYQISGIKSWVTNAEIADLFIVFAKESDSKQDIYLAENRITAFLIDKDTDGVIIKKSEDLVGLRGSGAAELHLCEAFVTEKDILGEAGNGPVIITKLGESSKFVVGSLTVSALKSLYDSVTDYVINAERYGKTLSYYQLVRKRLSKVIQMIYAMESVVYFNAAIYDTTVDPSFTLEDCAMKIFNSEGALFCIRELQSVLGAFGVSNQYLDTQRFYRDALTLTCFDHNNDIARLLIGLTGCQYAGNHHADEILKHRNPAFFPWETLKWAWRNRQAKLERFVLYQDIAGHLHPSFTYCGNQLEHCVQRLKLATDLVLNQHGRHVLETQFSPVRLANLAINLYARTAVLSRVSRSYCIGLTNTHEELKLAVSFCEDANTSFLKVFAEICRGDVEKDDLHLVIGQHIVDKRGYFPEHPLKHNF